MMSTSIVVPMPTATSSGSGSHTPTIDAIIDFARWAPSGDNTQPWRFEVVDDTHLVVHGFDTRDHCVYDLDGRPSQMSLGALIETASIAASAFGLRMRCVRQAESPETRPRFDLHFAPDAGVATDALLDVVKQRSVQRRPFATLSLTDEHKSALALAVAPDHAVRWVEGRHGRMAVARLLFHSAWLRLVTPEAYRVHRDVIAWGARFSDDKVPDQALGVGAPILALMRWALQSWGRVQFLNRFLAGTWAPRIQMDALPALACGAHFLLLARQAPRGLDDNVRAGRAMQRFWLTATRLGLMLQPELTPLIFARYAREGLAFSGMSGASAVANRVAARLTRIFGTDAISHGVFVGRIGHAPAPTSRSLRKDAKALRHVGMRNATSAR